jgi:hypothetical protein
MDAQGIKEIVQVIHKLHKEANLLANVATVSGAGEAINLRGQAIGIEYCAKVLEELCGNPASTVGTSKADTDIGSTGMYL